MDIEELINEFKKNRDSLFNMIKDIENYKEKLEIIFPEKFDNRYRKFFEEKIKAVISFFNTLLDIRKEINKSLKDEIEMRRKIENYEDDFITDIDIHEIAAKIEKIKNINKGEYLNA